MHGRLSFLTMNARSIAKLNAIDCLQLEKFAHKPSVITEEVRNNYISVATGVTRRMDLSTLLEHFQLTNIVVEPAREDRVLDVMLRNRTRYYSVNVFYSTVHSDHKIIYAKPDMIVPCPSYQA